MQAETLCCTSRSRTLIQQSIHPRNIFIKPGQGSRNNLLHIEVSEFHLTEHPSPRPRTHHQHYILSRIALRALRLTYLSPRIAVTSRHRNLLLLADRKNNPSTPLTLNPTPQSIRRNARLGKIKTWSKPTPQPSIVLILNPALKSPLPIRTKIPP